jgi:hypothetical protein
VLEVKYDDFPMETGLIGLILTLGESAGTLIANQSTGKFSTEGDAMSKTAL